MPITHIFFDIGGVLGTDGWDTDQRALAVERFGLDATDFAQRHQEAVGTFESGRMTLDEYLDITVFDAPRTCTREEFKEFMYGCSEPFHDTIAIARTLASTGRYRLMTLNNESAELNQHRVTRFGLVGIFSTFFSSCWMGVAKPSRRIYELTLKMSQADPEHSLFIDDREQNLAPARALGMQTIRYRDAGQLTSDLRTMGVELQGAKVGGN